MSIVSSVADYCTRNKVDNEDIKDKVAIVTGGANGIGYACVNALLQEGALYVAIFDITTDKTCLDEIIKEHCPDRVDLYTCDIANEDDFRANFKKVVEKHKYVDILINDAGVGNENHAGRLIDVNVKGTIVGNLIGIEYMGKHKGGQGGVIINIASILGLLDCHMLPVYSASKHAIVSFTRSMKDNYNTTGVKILAICPGKTKTKFEVEMAENHSKNYLDFIPKEKIDEFINYYVQSPLNVSDAVVQLITEAECGSVWVVERDDATYKISSTDHYVEKIINHHEAKLFFCW